MTRHDMTPHHIDMTWHDISQLTTLPPFTSPHSQPHYHHFISPRSQPHDITAHYITTTDTPRKHNQQPPKRHPQTERLRAGAHKKLGLGIALVLSPCAHSISNLLLWLVFFPLKLLPPPPARPGTTLIMCYNYRYAGYHITLREVAQV